MSLTTLLDGLAIPIVQAPMVGASDVELAVAVCAAGGCGTLAAGALAPQDIGPAVAEIRARTAAPFGVNLLMAPKAAPTRDELDRALARLAPWYAKAGLPPPEAPDAFAPDFEAQLEAVIAAAPPMASFTFSILTQDQVAALHGAGVQVIGTATTVAEAEASLVGTIALVATVRAAVDLPVIAAGGIMDGRGVAAALALGASAAQMGTAFLLCDEALTSPPWRAALTEAGDDPTRLTRAFTGRYARGLENGFMRGMHAAQDEVPAYPVQNRLTQPLRAAATRAGDPEMMSLWAGQGVRLATAGRAGDMVRRWWAQAGEAAAEAAARTGRGASA
jgi:nitronate monooxygenase